MPRKPKATRPKAKTGDTSWPPMVIDAPRPIMLTKYAAPMRAIMVMPIQKALKLPAVRPDEDVERGAALAGRGDDLGTCALSVEVKTLMSSGMIAPASVPHVMIAESFHHCESSPARRGRAGTTRRT